MALRPSGESCAPPWGLPGGESLFLVETLPQGREGAERGWGGEEACVPLLPSTPVS